MEKLKKSSTEEIPSFDVQTGQIGRAALFAIRYRSLNCRWLKEDWNAKLSF